METWCKYILIGYTTEDHINNSLFRELFSGIQYTHGSRLYMPLFILRRFAFVMIIVPESLSTIVKIFLMIIVQILFTIANISKCIIVKYKLMFRISHPTIQKVQIQHLRVYKRILHDWFHIVSIYAQKQKFMECHINKRFHLHDYLKLFNSSSFVNK